MPILNRDDAAEVRDSFDQFFEAEPEERASTLRQLFTETLDFERVAGYLDLTPARARAGIELPTSAERIASLDGVNVFYVALSGPDRVRRSEVVAVAKQARDDLGEDMLLLFSNAATSQLHWIWPDFGSSANPTLKRMVVERDLSRRTVIQQISNIYWRFGELGNLLDSIKEAFDVEPVTKEFLKQYKTLFEAAEEKIEGFAASDQGREERKQFVQTLFNRLMFVYFLSRKGWLKFEGETDYLNALWDAYAEHPDHDSFYRDRLTFLFFEGLNNPDSRDVRRGVDFLIGDVPFLNGGLFEESALDRLDGVHVPDDAVRPLMTELFDKFNFTVTESTPLDIEVAVDPEMLGKVFEELVTGRHDSGAYYTPRPVVSFMCREALVGYLGSRAPAVGEEALRRLVEDDDASQIPRAAAPAIGAALDSVTVVDPACGSGAYLVGMMQELLELYDALYSERLLDDPKSVYDLKLQIIERNLHGVDIDEFAVEIARLRLWLSLSIDYAGDKPRPLPNLNFKIIKGDSLMARDPSAGIVARNDELAQTKLGRRPELLEQLRDKKHSFFRAELTKDKDDLREEIDAIEAEIRESEGFSAPPKGAVDWPLTFAEVMLNGAFDIAIANPPYIQLQKDGAKLRKLYASCGFETLTARGDIYQLFYERGCQLLRPDGGLMAYVTSNSWLRAQYGKTTRAFFARNHQPLRWLDLGKDVFESAIVDSGVLTLRVGGPAAPFPSVDMDTLSDQTIPPRAEHWGETRPYGDAPWSVLSMVEWSVMEKMQRLGTPLRDQDVKTNLGVITGLNEAFVIDSRTRERILDDDPRSVELIKPVVRGRDLRRFKRLENDLWLIASHTGIGERDYEGIRRHLLAHKEKLLARRIGANPQTGEVPYEWWQMAADNHAAHKAGLFEGEKLFWMDLTDRGRFVYESDPAWPLNTVYMLTGRGMKQLCAYLNSNLVTWHVQATTLTSGMGVARWFAGVVSGILTPKFPSRSKVTLASLLDQILAAKNREPNADTSALEAEIDRHVYELYGLTEEEIAAVESRLAT
ncbi:MAG: hypothetical protein F4Z38_07995 [Chloroflexi bacterium]|nr:hypothetical protein [Chloroflexota bacterium]